MNIWLTFKSLRPGRRSINAPIFGNLTLRARQMILMLMMHAHSLLRAWTERPPIVIAWYGYLLANPSIVKPFLTQTNCVPDCLLTTNRSRIPTTFYYFILYICLITYKLLIKISKNRGPHPRLVGIFIEWLSKVVLYARSQNPVHADWTWWLDVGRLKVQWAPYLLQL